MKAILTHEGELCILPETTTESYALHQWEIENAPTAKKLIIGEEKNPDKEVSPCH